MDNKIIEILRLLDNIDEFARNSRGYYENARGNDTLCYHATNQIREILNLLNNKLENR